jgi:sulfatase maturation enzyme AslB (radical SAM superfamily)
MNLLPPPNKAVANKERMETIITKLVNRLFSNYVYLDRSMRFKMRLKTLTANNYGHCTMRVEVYAAETKMGLGNIDFIPIFNTDLKRHSNAVELKIIKHVERYVGRRMFSIYLTFTGCKGNYDQWIRNIFDNVITYDVGYDPV